MAAMSDDELIAEVEARIADADSFMGDALTKERDKALKYYRRDPFGDEVAGRSTVVTGDVAQHIDTIMPSLMRIFSGGDEVVRFEPQGPEDEEGAKQATDYVNWIWNQQNDGFTTFHDWFKDGLLSKLGVIKVWWEVTDEPVKSAYSGLTLEDVAALDADPDIAVDELVEVQTEFGPLYDAKTTKTEKSGRVRIANLPPEEFLFGKRTRSADESDVLAHRSRKTASELISEGYDRKVIEALPNSDGVDPTGEEIERFKDVDDANRNSAQQGSTREIEVIEAYLHLDRNGDGIAEWLKVCYAGRELLDCEEIDDHPFAVLTPIKMPHRMVGFSIADQTMDLQKIKSTVLRQALDNMYLQNMPQVVALEGQVNLDDLLSRKVGGVIRAKSPGAVTPLPTQPLGQEPFQMIEYLDSQGEQRTGATRYNQGLDANTLNKTASGINLIQNAAAQRIELIARVYGETGVKRAFRRILALVCKHQERAKTIKLRGKWVAMNPSEWNARMDMTATVGLGNGNRDQTLAHMMMLLDLDKQVIELQGGAQGPLVTMENVYAKLKKVVEAAGLRSVDSYYTDPGNAPPPPPKPSPKMMELQGKMHLAQQEAQQSMQIEQFKAEKAAELEQFKAQKKAEIEMIQAQADIAVQQQQGQIHREMAELNARVKVFEAGLKASQSQPGPAA